ncbi:hypothetical protein GSI_05695 [Ganoderma sinense ZZ0214-1]|uniref:Uncharacterized protein n=1 Tax=Ganoderma sinense ZZ0214-1 TaxID=1077348 RepID=A0A2G8SB94_9APHY|nr:hypothetical protein GSI_05695 [Ganoderma sinense ZZ0214-1]
MFSLTWITRSVAITVHPTSTTPDYGPFKNASQFRLMDYFYGRSDSKSLNTLDDLIAVIRSPGFSPEDLKGFSAKKAEHALDIWVSSSGVFSQEDGWHEGSVNIALPKTGAKYKSEEDVPKFNVPGIIYCRLLPLIKGVVEDTASHFSCFYHWLPHKAEHAMLQADEEIRKKAHNLGDAPGVEYVVLPMLFWSDVTQLSSFSSAVLWPIYLYFGNLSKYVRGRPTEFVAHHLAYISSLPDTLKDVYTAKYGHTSSVDILKFCKHELFQQIWVLLFDSDFMNAYEHGYAINGTCVENWLVKDSLMPIQSTFSTHFFQHGINFYNTLAPDLMHEFELSVWKGVFTHLMHMLTAKGADVVEEFNSQMRHMPTFGYNQIHRFWHDVASHKHLAVRDYEAFLITMMPTFEGLLDLPDDSTIADLLFELVNWLALAKLHLHTAVTLQPNICTM